MGYAAAMDPTETTKSRWCPARSARRGAVGAALVLVTALTLSACGSGSSGGTTLILYNAQHEQTTDALVTAFTKQTGIRVLVDNNDEDVLTAQIEQEGGRSPADVFYTENSNWLEQLGERGMLAKVDPATLASVPRGDNATSGDWVGVSARISTMVYNTGKLSPSQLPTSVLDLADPRWKGEIEIAPAETDFWPIVASVAQAEGDAATVTWLEGLKANAGADDNVPDNETVTSDVNQGVNALGVINHYYWYRLRAEVGSSSIHSAIAYFAPGDAGYVEDISGAAVLKSSTHQAAAQRFLAFLTSETGQRILAQGESFEYPIRPGVSANPQLTPLDQLHPNPFSPAQLGTGLVAKELLERAGLI